MLGAVVYIRFGGPPFSPHYVQLAEFIAQQISLLVERQNLQRAYDQLEAQNQEARLQEDFISTITHELRTPLGFIKGYATTLLRSDTTWDPATQDEFLTIIDQETDRLQELIENLLDSARLQSGTLKMDFQAVRLDVLVRSVIERTRLHHPDFVAHVECASNMSAIEGDPKRLGQVFDNLISNAIKYAPGTEVWVRINLDDREALIEVSDQGPGIPNRYITHLFERFFRNPDVAPSVHGSGLGLFICKKIIQAHHGSITVTSVVNQGTTFHIRLPIKNEKTGIGGVLREEI
jgi:signal transduction histidine kinase